MKQLGIALLIAGVSICATWGARLSPEIHDQLAVKGQQTMANARAKALLGEYCEARTGASLKPADGCPAAKDADEAAQKAAQAPEANVAGLPPKVQTTRKAWAEAKAKAGEAAAAAKGLQPIDPGTRLSSWFSESGIIFLAGLVLVLGGAIISRKAVKAEALSDKPSGGRGPVDFGQLLGELAADVQKMVQEAGQIPNPSPAELESLKQTLEGLQYDKVDPLVDARARLIGRYGLGGFAEVFGPLSGAERRMNRAWTAMVDRHWPEARDSLERAATELKNAEAALAKLKPA